VLPGLGATHPSKCLIFYKQLESEKQIHVNISTMCHGTQGARNIAKDATTGCPKSKFLSDAHIAQSGSTVLSLTHSYRYTMYYDGLS